MDSRRNRPLGAFVAVVGLANAAVVGGPSRDQARDRYILDKRQIRVERDDPAVEDIRLGAALRRIRLRLGQRQVDVADRAGVSQGLISKIELGQIGGVSVDTLRHIFAAVGARLDLEARWRGTSLDRLIDERHAALVESRVIGLTAWGWDPRVEVSYSIFGERGSIDVLGGMAGRRAVVVEEIKSDFVRVDDTVRKLDEKARLVDERIAVDRFGWRPALVGRILVLPDTDRCRRQVRSHAATLDAAFPQRGDDVRRWLRDPIGAMSGILFVANSAGGRGARGRVGIQRVRVRRQRPE